jgi:hypothetical protein
MPGDAMHRSIMAPRTTEGPFMGEGTARPQRLAAITTAVCREATPAAVGRVSAATAVVRAVEAHAVEVRVAVAAAAVAGDRLER